MINDIYPSTCSRPCQADRTCGRLPCFQACLDASQGAMRPQIHKRTEACANHLGAMVIALTAWAREQDVTSADLTVLIIEPPSYDTYPRRHQLRDYPETSGFIFSIIHLGEPDPAGTRAAFPDTETEASRPSRQGHPVGCLKHPGQLVLIGAQAG